MGTMRPVGVRRSGNIESRVRGLFPDRLDGQRFDEHLIERRHLFGRGIFLLRIFFRAALAECHGDVDVFKNLARRDADDAVERFDEIISAASTVLATEGIDEAERGTESLGLDQEPSAIGLPFRRFHWRLTRLNIFGVPVIGIAATTLAAVKVFVRGEGECTVEMAPGQFSIFGAIEDKGEPRILRIITDRNSISLEIFAHDLVVFRTAEFESRLTLGIRCSIVHRVCTGNAESRVSVAARSSSSCSST